MLDRCVFLITFRLATLGFLYLCSLLTIVLFNLPRFVLVEWA